MDEIKELKDFERDPNPSPEFVESAISLECEKLAKHIEAIAEGFDALQVLLGKLPEDHPAHSQVGDLRIALTKQGAGIKSLGIIPTVCAIIYGKKNSGLV